MFTKLTKLLKKKNYHKVLDLRYDQTPYFSKQDSIRFGSREVLDMTRPK